MPYYEYLCPNMHETTEFFPTFGEAAPFIDGVACTICGEHAVRVFSVPLEAHFYGNPDGYHKPSATKRYSYKKSMSTGNETSMG